MDQTKPLVDVSLFLHGDSLNPAQVTLMLGTEGSKTRSKGEKWRTSTDHEVTAQTGLWSLSASRESMSVRDQLSWLRQKLSSATCTPSRIPGVQYADIDVFIALGSNDQGGGDHEFQLTLEDLAWISSLGTTISFTLTYVREEPQDIMGQQEK
jgi:hypothetical protein